MRRRMEKKPFCRGRNCAEDKIKEEQHDAEQNWLGATLEGLRFHLEGWLKSLLQTILLLVIVFIVIGLVYSCITAKIARSSIMNRSMLTILAKNHEEFPLSPLAPGMDTRP